MTTEQDAEASTEGSPSFPQGASRRGRAHAEHAELQAALWLAARAAIINGRRRRQERHARASAAEAAGAGMRRSG